MTEHRVYRGRFAPSPTGALHLGSLLAAVGSFLQARSQRGEWLVRIEDIDTPRCIPGAADDILRDLEHFGLNWDGEVLWQSQRQDAYAAALAQLQDQGLAYPCACSRKEIEDTNLAHGRSGLVYPGTCRSGLRGRSARAWRINTEAAVIGYEDLLQGSQVEDLEKTSGDFVLKRADGLWAYQLAVVVDDAEQGVTQVVRGVDLLDSTARQIYLQQCLDLPQPTYLHLPVLVDQTGQKLSKRDFAPAIADRERQAILRQTLGFLGLPLDRELEDAGIEELLDWAIRHWEPGKLPKSRYITLP